MRRVLHLLPYLEAGGTERGSTYSCKISSRLAVQSLSAAWLWGGAFSGVGLSELISQLFSRASSGSLPLGSQIYLNPRASHSFFAAGKTGLPIVFTGYGHPTKFDYWLAPKAWQPLGQAGYLCQPGRGEELPRLWP